MSLVEFITLAPVVKWQKVEPVMVKFWLNKGDQRIYGICLPGMFQVPGGLRRLAGRAVAIKAALGALSSPSLVSFLILLPGRLHHSFGLSFPDLLMISNLSLPAPVPLPKSCGLLHPDVSLVH